MRKLIGIFISILTQTIFLVLDFLDTILCILFKIIDGFFEGESNSCYCRGERGDSEVSESLFGRRNVFREMGLIRFWGKFEGSKRNVGGVRGDNSNYNKINRWSDCGCEDCVLWRRNGDQNLHLVVREPAKATFGSDCRGRPTENVIFLHGFLSSSSLWIRTIFPNMSENTSRNYKLFAVDLLGFGKSPKPRDSLYTLKDHVEMIEKSVIFPFKLHSFHIVAHSMGCVIALALAAKYSGSVKSITLVAP